MTVEHIQDVFTIDFCYGFIQFTPTLSLQLPGGISFDLMHYWDGQPVCCERKREVECEGEAKGGGRCGIGLDRGFRRAVGPCAVVRGDRTRSGRGAGATLSSAPNLSVLDGKRGWG